MPPRGLFFHTWKCNKKGCNHFLLQSPTSRERRYFHLRKKNKQAIINVDTRCHKHIVPEKGIKANREAWIRKGHTTSSPDDWHLPFLESYLHLDYKENNHSSAEKGEGAATTMTNIKERRRKEVLPFSLSLQILWWSFVYYGYAQKVIRGTEIQNQRIPKDHGLKKSQEPRRKKTLP